MKLLKTVIKERQMKITPANERLILRSNIRVDEKNNMLVHTGKVDRDDWKLTAIQLRCRPSPYGNAAIFDILMSLGFMDEFFRFRGRKAKIEKVKTFLGNFQKNIKIRYPRIIGKREMKGISTAGIEFKSRQSMVGKIPVKKGEEQKSLMFKDTYHEEAVRKKRDAVTPACELFYKRQRRYRRAWTSARVKDVTYSWC